MPKPAKKLLNRINRRSLVSALENCMSDGFTGVLDVEENDGGYLIRAEMPGLRKEEISVESRNGSLVISGESRRNRKESGLDDWGCEEKLESAFESHIRLPDGISEEEISAIYRNGILEITLPRGDADKLRKITIN